MASRADIIKEIQVVMPLTKRLIHTRMQESLKEHGLTHGELEFLFALREPASNTAAHIAKKLHMTAGAVSQLVDSQVRLGFVTRRLDPNDRWVCNLALSPAGRTVVESMIASRQAMMAAAMDDLTTQELELLLSVQQKLVNALQKGK